MIHEVIYYTHITAAVTCFLLGGVAVLVSKEHGLHTKVGETYFWVMVYAMMTAFYLATKDESIIFMVVAFVTLFCALQGYLAVKVRRPAKVWIKKHLFWVGSSYILCWTALAVKGFPGPVILHWIWPAIIGGLIIWRYKQRKLPQLQEQKG